MFNKTEQWIILSMGHESRARGTEPTELFRNRADFITNDLSAFLSVIGKLEKEGFLEMNKKALAPLYYVTKDGKDELGKSLKKINQVEFMSLMRSVPLAEIRYRMRMMEGLLGSLILVLLISLLIYGLYKINYGQPTVLAIVFVLFFTSLLLASTFGALTLYNFLDTFCKGIFFKFS